MRKFKVAQIQGCKGKFSLLKLARVLHQLRVPWVVPASVAHHSARKEGANERTFGVYVAFNSFGHIATR